MPDHEELFLRWELDLADAGDEAALAELLCDPAMRRAFIRNARIAAALGAPLPAGAMHPPRARPRRSAPRWAPHRVSAAAVLLVAGLVALLTATLQRDRPATPMARLVSGDGARVQGDDGRWRTAGTGEAIAAGETVQSGSGTAVLVLGAGLARLELAAGSSLSLPIAAIDPATAPVPLRLATGRIDAEVARRPPGAALSIRTPLAIAEVLGTRFSFSASPDGARLAVTSGAVRLSTDGDAGVVVAAGRTALVAGGLASMAPAAADPEPPLPAGSRVLQRFDPVDASGWRGVIEDAIDGGPAWRSVAPRPGDPWSRAELRSPLRREDWTVAPGTWLRFRYHVERAAPGLALEVHLKPQDESNYAQRLIADTGDGWHQALLRVDGGFRHLQGGRPLVVGERIHGAVWCAMGREGGPTTPVRLWIRDAVLFSAP
jgi:ferric-dicitrate binding protein FerR (iron transport regulator)